MVCPAQSVTPETSHVMREVLPVIERIPSPPVRKMAFEIAQQLSLVSLANPKFRCVLRVCPKRTQAVFITNERNKQSPVGWSCVDINGQRVFIACGIHGTCSGKGCDKKAIARIADVIGPRRPAVQRESQADRLEG